MKPALRRKRIWGVTDLADFLDWHFLKARRFLLRLDAKHGGKLLLPRGGVNRPHEFYVATLAKLEPDLFEPIDSLEVRVDELEEGLGEVRADLRRTVLQTGSNTRDIAKMRSHRAAS